MECYDPGTEDWTFVTEMEKARSGLSLIAIDHNIYMIGGRYKTADQYFDVTERYCFYVGQKDEKKTLPFPKYSFDFILDQAIKNRMNV